MKNTGIQNITSSSGIASDHYPDPPQEQSHPSEQNAKENAEIVPLGGGHDFIEDKHVVQAVEHPISKAIDNSQDLEEVKEVGGAGAQILPKHTEDLYHPPIDPNSSSQKREQIDVSTEIKGQELFKEVVPVEVMANEPLVRLQKDSEGSVRSNNPSGKNTSSDQEFEAKKEMLSSVISKLVTLRKAIEEVKNCEPNLADLLEYCVECRLDEFREDAHVSQKLIREHRIVLQKMKVSALKKYSQINTETLEEVISIMENLVE